jgi:hypothetical protein
VNTHFHTIKITGHLSFYSRHGNFRSAFRDFLENENNEGIQLQITDMVNTELLSMEIGAKISISRTIADISDSRFAQVDDSNPQVIAPPVENVVPVSVPVKSKPRPKTKPKTKADLANPVNPETGSDLCFY